MNKNKISNEELKNLLEETKTEVKRLDEECEQFRKERADVVRELEIDEFSSFIKSYKKIEMESQDISNTVK